MRTYDKLYIDGKWVEPSGKETLEVIDSATEEVIATIPASDASDVDRAVRAAKAAFPAWAAASTEERSKYLIGIRDGLEARRSELAEMFAREVGMPLTLSDRVQVSLGVGGFANAARVIESYPW